jgi:replicative DNA helicase
MSAPDRTNGHSTEGTRRGFDGPIAPPQNLEAEQSVLGAVLLSDTALPALIIDERLHPDDFYRDGHARIYQAMLDLHTLGEPVDALTLVEHLKQAGDLESVGGRAAIDLLAGSVPAVGNVRQYARIVRDNAMLRRLLRASYEIQSRVHSHEALPRDLVDMAERAILEVAHEDSRKDFRAIHDLLESELNKLERLSREGKAITGTASGFEDLDTITGGFQGGNLVILAARPSMGKCLAGSALVYDPRTGGRRRIDELVASIGAGKEAFVAAVGPDLKLRTARVSAGLRSGRQAVFRLRTRLGRAVTVTANHPLLTFDGWQELRDITPGTRIAVPRRLPRACSEMSMPDHEIVLLAALIADGNLTQSTPRFCFGEGSRVLPEVERAAQALGLRVSTAHGGTACISAGRGAGPNPLTELCKWHGLWGRRSSDKFVPDAIFALGDDQIARFLSILYACDGHVYASDRYSQIGYTTISERLAGDVQHLLLRLGVVASIRTLRRDVYEGTETVAREVRITSRQGVDRFAGTIPVVGKEDRLARVAALGAARRAKAVVDTLPVKVWDQVLEAKGERSWAEISATAGHPRNHNWHVGTRGVSRPQLTVLAAATDSAVLHELAGSDLWWDEVASVEYEGEVETYDLTVPGDHNFVADDIVVHNSALMANFAENAALESRKAVALFSLEMSESELAQRFIASQASIRGDDLRKGKVPPSRWPKILQASNRLAESPLYIDDSSDLSVLDVRAKARRLAQQNADGLGLILIDYLQLMRASGTVENRVEQIGQISRGLKTLARELEVPVIALSQLNRGVEQRTDKRPVLSDLRESGCLAGETRVYLPDAGEYRRIDELVGMRDFRVSALNTETWKLEPCRVSNAFSTGHKPVFEMRTRLGRTLRATANHRFLTVEGWRRLDELAPGTHIAMPRALPSPSQRTMSDDELALLGHLIGDGCTLPRHAIQYTTRERELAEIVADLATRVFGEALAPRIRAERNWHQVYLSATERLTHGKRNPVAAWMDELGAFGLRSHEKRVPDEVFRQPAEAIELFLRHLWATDGCLWPSAGQSRIYYATSSQRLANDVQDLLLRLGICATVYRIRQRNGRPQYHVDVTGKPDQTEFVLRVWAVGDRRERQALALADRLGVTRARTNRDVIPALAWRTIVEPARTAAGVTTRRLQAGLDTSYCGSTLYESNLGRERAARVAEIVGSDELRRLAVSDVYWDRIEAIDPDGETEVYDLTVQRHHNFVSNGVITHNSIEQDADLVMFIYRDEYYHEDSEREGIADLIISKHRNGGLGTVELAFQKEFPRFMSYAGDDGY